MFNGKTHQVFGVQNISKVKAGKLDVVHKTTIEDGKYTERDRLHENASVSARAAVLRDGRPFSPDPHLPDRAPWISDPTFCLHSSKGLVSASGWR